MILQEAEFSSNSYRPNKLKTMGLVRMENPQTLIARLKSVVPGMMQADVENSLDNAWSALPDADDVWEIDSDASNTLGVLNGLKTGLDVGDATEHLKEAKKWFTMGQRADAFDDADDLADSTSAISSADGSAPRAAASDSSTSSRVSLAASPKSSSSSSAVWLMTGPWTAARLKRRKPR